MPELENQNVIYLKLIAGPCDVKDIELKRGAEQVIGRDPASCTFAIPHALKLSRRHFIVSFEEDGVYVSDLGSTNGTYINQVRISGRTRLLPGQDLMAGKCHFVLAGIDEQPTLAATKNFVPGVRDILEIGTKFAAYTIRDVIGFGGMGTVYLAEDKDGGKVAIKVMNLSLKSRGALMDQRFLREIRHGMSIRHPGIIQTLAWGTEFGRDYMVMEYFKSRNLYDVVEESGGLPLATATNYAVQLLAALVAAHGRGLIHRDIKPENLLISDDGTLKLVDLGLSKSIRESSLSQINLTRAGATLGTPCFISPEQIEDAANVDCRADLFSVGVTYYNMLTAKLPFDGIDQFTILQKVLYANPIPIRQIDPRLPAWVELVVEKAMQKDPDLRFQSAEEFRSAIVNR